MKKSYINLSCFVTLLFFSVLSCSAEVPDLELPVPDTDIIPQVMYKAGSYTDPASHNTILYRLFTPDRPPKDEDPRGYPLVIFLHGIGERGSDNISQLRTGSKYFISWKNHYPAYILFPQCPNSNYWSMARRPYNFDPEEMEFFEATSWMYNGLNGLIDNIVRTNNINPDRIILVGYSMGAISALDFSSRNPRKFAGVASIAGTMPAKRMPLMAETDVWVYHNDSDGKVPSKGSHQLVDTLQNMGANVQASFHGPGGHVTLHLFDTSEFMQWIYSRHRH